MNDKKELLLEATLTCVAEKGLQRSTTAEIARRASVGEGTLYRYFASKEELIEQTAFYAGAQISEALERVYDETIPVEEQFIMLCQEFLRVGIQNPLLHRFIEQFRNSPQGLDFKRKRLHEVIIKKRERPFFYPLDKVILRALEKGYVKDYPFQVLASLTIGPLLFIVKDGSEGLLEMDDGIIENVAQACWDSIRLRAG